MQLRLECPGRDSAARDIGSAEGGLTPFASFTASSFEGRRAPRIGNQRASAAAIAA
jgi:hypothetical protein